MTKTQGGPTSLTTSQKVPRPETVRAIHEMMVRIRLFEDRVGRADLERRIPYMSFLSTGQEAVAAGVCAALRADDYIVSTHRGLGHAIAKGVALGPLMAEVFGRVTGISHGRGGSINMVDVSVGFLGCNAIIGDGFGIATGAGLSAHLRRSGQVSVCFFGDSAINKGQFHEALNFAAVKKLPVVFICENNQYAFSATPDMTTPIHDFSRRAVSYGIPGETVDGNDALAVFERTGVAVERARSGAGPTLLCLETYRLAPHNGRLADPRPKEEIAARRKADPLPRLEAWMHAHGLLDEKTRGFVWSAMAAEVEAAEKFAVSSAEPNPSTALDHIFAK